MLHYLREALGDPDGGAASRYYLKEANFLLVEYQRDIKDGVEILLGENEELKEERRDAYCRPLSPEADYNWIPSLSEMDDLLKDEEISDDDIYMTDQPIV